MKTYVRRINEIQESILMSAIKEGAICKNVWDCLESMMFLNDTAIVTSMVDGN